MPRDKSVEHRLVHRFKIARGHLDKVIQMLEAGDYCIDVVHQSLAVQSALKKADEEVLVNHMQTCVADAIKKGNSDEVVSEMIKIMEKKQ